MRSDDAAHCEDYQRHEGVRRERDKLAAENKALRREVERLTAREDEYEYRVVGEWPDFKGTYAITKTREGAEWWLPRFRSEFEDGDVFIERRRTAGPWAALKATPPESKADPGT